MKPAFFSLILAAASFALPSTAQTQLTGDMNGDGRLTVDDVALLVEAVMEFDEQTDNLDNAGKAYVDLGLTSGTLWATCNIGADRPEGYGHYFAWGETQAKSRYYPGNYMFMSNAATVLSLADDAARVQWGGRWRMPTEKELNELRNECVWEWTSQGTSKGYIVRSRVKHTSIFLPAAGVSTMAEVLGQNDHGVYWTSCISADDSDRAVCLELISTRHNVDTEERFLGATIRPVLDAKAAK